MSYDFRARTNTHALSSFFYYFATYQLFLRNEQKIYLAFCIEMRS